jgi:hypothetical protein
MGCPNTQHFHKVDRRVGHSNCSISPLPTHVKHWQKIPSVSGGHDNYQVEFFLHKRGCASFFKCLNSFFAPHDTRRVSQEQYGKLLDSPVSGTVQPYGQSWSAHVAGWMVSGQETIFHWARGPELTTMVRIGVVLTVLKTFYLLCSKMKR